MSVLITGATGFVGQNITQYLLQKNIEVAVLARNAQRAKKIFNNNVEVIEGDVTSEEFLIKASKKREAIFHLAGVVGYSKKQRDEMELVNVESTKNIVKAVVKNNVPRLIHFSSVAAIGASLSPNTLDETASFNLEKFNLGYFETKRKSEEAVKQAFLDGKIDTVILNPSTIYGYGDAEKGSRKIQVLVAQGKFPFYPSGGVSIISIEDVCEATFNAWKKGRSGERYILSGENLLLKDVFELIAKEASVRPPRFLLSKHMVLSLGKIGDVLEHLQLKGPINSENAWASVLYHWYDNSKAKKELNLNPKPASFAIANSVQWMKEHNVLPLVKNN